MNDYLGIHSDIADAVAVVRERKLRRIAANYFPSQKRRKPRFCVTTTIRLCPRQSIKKYKT